MKNKKVLIISIIMILILIMSGTVYAYFTTYAEASGNVTFIFNDTEIAVTSKLENGKLNINIENIGDEDTFVRAKVLIPDYAKVSSNSANWTLKTDGYWYYDKVLETGNKSTTLQLMIEKQESLMLSQMRKQFVYVIMKMVVHMQTGNLHMKLQM